MNYVNRNLLSLLALAAMVLTSLLLYGDLPQQLPSSFNFEGQVQRSTSKDSLVALLPGIYLGVIVLTNVLIALSPQKFSMPNSKRAMDIILFGIGVMLFFLHFALLQNRGDYEFFVRYFSYGMALFLVICGNVFGKTERNFFIGLRLPWTINSDANWRATHRLAGRLMVIMGAVLLISNSLLVAMWLTLLLSISPLVLPLCYSYYYFRAYEQNGDNGPAGEESSSS